MPRLAPARAALPLLAAALLAACASPPPDTGAPPGAVSVLWNDAGSFAEAREDPRDTPAAREAWLGVLGRHLAEQAAAVLPRDQRLQVRFTDIRRAGNREPWRGPQAADLRVVRDVYPPRIVLEFRREAADGRVLQSGQRTLRDPSFLMRPTPYAGDPLGHEKLLLDDWVRREFGPRR